MFRKFLSPDGDSGGTGGEGNESVTPPLASSGTQSQQDLLKQIGALQAKYDADLAAAEKRRVGLQKTYDTEKGVWATTQSDLITTKNALDLLTGEKTTLAEQLSNLEKEKVTLTSQVGSLGVKVKRAALIFDKYHGLASFEAAGLIPDVPEDKLDETFKVFAEKLASVTDASKLDFSLGSTPLPPDKKNTIPDNLETLRKKLNEAALRGDNKTFNATYDEILKLETAKK